MASEKHYEALIGIFVLSAMAVIIGMILTFGKGASILTQTYQVTIRFNHIGDLSAGAPVKLGGVRIGQINSIMLQPNGKITASASIYDSVRLKTDAVTRIQTSGIVGDSFVELSMGSSAVELPRDGSAAIDGSGQITTTELLAQVKDIGIKVTELVDNVNGIIGNEKFKTDIHATMANTSAAAKNAELFLADLRKTSENIQASSETIRTVVTDIHQKVASKENIEALAQMIQNAKTVSVDATKMSEHLKAILSRSDTLFAEEEPKIRTAVADVATITHDLKVKLEAIQTDKGLLRYFTTDDMNVKIESLFKTIDEPLKRLALMLENMSKVDLMTSYAKGNRLARRAEKEHSKAGRDSTEEILDAEFEAEERAFERRAKGPDSTPMLP